jgi:hypothetical protein
MLSYNNKNYQQRSLKNIGIIIKLLLEKILNVHENKDSIINTNLKYHISLHIHDVPNLSYNAKMMGD